MQERYQRQMILSEVGVQGQEKLSKAKVLVIGGGGLGCPCLQYLAACGVGTLGIVDFDKVSESNLARQILFDLKDIGKNKAMVLKKKLLAQNPNIKIVVYPNKFEAQNGLEIVSNFDIVVDCTDNFQSKYLINDSCILLNKPLVYASLYKFQGQLAVFNFNDGPSLRCLFPVPPDANEIPNCNEIGMLGTVSGTIGTMQAHEVIKIILGLEITLNGKIIYIDLLNYSQKIWSIQKNPSLINQIKQERKLNAIDQNDCELINEISLKELNSQEKVTWIDVRELGEEPTFDSPFVVKIPMSKIMLQPELINLKGKKILFCQTGQRARKVFEDSKNKSIANLFVLKESAMTLKEWLGLGKID